MNKQLEKALVSDMATINRNPYPYHLDKFHDKKEITKLVLFFKTKKEVESFTDYFCTELGLKKIRNDKISKLLE